MKEVMGIMMAFVLILQQNVSASVGQTLTFSVFHIDVSLKTNVFNVHVFQDTLA